MKIKIIQPDVAKRNKIGDISNIQIEGKDVGEAEIVAIIGDEITLKILDEEKYKSVIGDWLDFFQSIK